MLRIFVGEGDRRGDRPLYRALVEQALARNMAGATALPGPAGFGPSGRVRSELYTDTFPGDVVVVEIVDTEEKVREYLEAIDDLIPNSMVLFNESFASTNEQEGEEIARHVVTALVERRVEVFFVSHQFEFARAFEGDTPLSVLFLRAERRADGSRTFKVIEGQPLRTSYGEDLYKRTFVDAAQGAQVLQDATDR